MGGEAVSLGRRQAGGCHLGAGLGFCLAARQRLGLRQGMGQQDAVASGMGVVGAGDDHEIHRHGRRTLVDQLHEGMLGVRPRLPEHHRAGGHGHRRAFGGHALAEGFHLHLLQMRGQAGEPFVIGQHGAGGVAEGVHMPELRQRQQQRQVLGVRRRQEMLIHRAGAGQ